MRCCQMSPAASRKRWSVEARLERSKRRERNAGSSRRPHQLTFSTWMASTMSRRVISEICIPVTLSNTISTGQVNLYFYRFPKSTIPMQIKIKCRERHKYFFSGRLKTFILIFKFNYRSPVSKLIAARIAVGRSAFQLWIFRV